MHKILKWVDRFKNKPRPITRSNAKKALSPSDFNVFLEKIADMTPVKPTYATVTNRLSHLLELQLPIFLHGQTVKIMDQDQQVVTVRFKGEQYRMLIDMIEII